MKYKIGDLIELTRDTRDPYCEQLAIVVDSFDDDTYMLANYTLLFLITKEKHTFCFDVEWCAYTPKLISGAK